MSFSLSPSFSLLGLLLTQSSSPFGLAFSGVPIVPLHSSRFEVKGCFLGRNEWPGLASGREKGGKDGGGIDFGTAREKKGAESEKRGKLSLGQ